MSELRDELNKEINNESSNELSNGLSGDLNDNEEESPQSEEPASRRRNPIKWLVRVFQGALIGGGAILPGISGGVLAVSFGVYRPMMAVLAYPRRNLKKYLYLMLPIAIGWALGFVFFAKMIKVMFAANEVRTTWLFIGLIGGTLPGLFKTASAQGKSRWDWPLCALAFAAFTGLMLLARTGLSADLTPNLGWFFFCGVLWGLSLVVPGMTSSSLLMSMGLFLPMTEGIAAKDPGVIIPMLLGIGAVVLALSRLVNYLFETYHSQAYHFIIGLMLASTVVIIPLEYNTPQQIVASASAAVIGFLLAWIMDRYEHE